jgi:phosphatidylglycerol:prolipoprotein diacylglycerol transferase
MNEKIQPLDPIAFTLGPIEVHWYGIIIGSGLALALYLAIREGNRRGLPKETFADLMIWAIPIAIISARIYYVLFEWGYYSKHVGEIPKIWNGGIAIHGALIGSVITVYIFSRARDISFWKITDIAAPSLILGQAIGRWGNFINQEAFGNVITNPSLQFFPVAVYIEKLGEWHQATFFYESAWNMVLFCIVLLLSRKKVKLWLKA